MISGVTRPLSIHLNSSGSSDDIILAGYRQAEPDWENSQISGRVGGAFSNDGGANYTGISNLNYQANVLGGYSEMHLGRLS